MAPKILHIASDEKFINNANWSFEKAYEKCNHFIILIPSNKHVIQYVDIKENFELVSVDGIEYENLTKRFDDYDLVVLHGMSYENSCLVLNCLNKNKFLWLVWGTEIYDNKYLHGNFVLGKKTQKQFQTRIKLFDRLEQFYYQIKSNLFRAKPTKGQSIAKAISAISKIGVLHIEEIQLLQDFGYVKKDIQPFWFTYYPIEFIFKNIKNLEVESNNILLGNSASKSNNHVEAFDILKEFNLGERKIIAPLSYGSEHVKEEVIKEGHKIFGKTFIPLTSFMPLSEYNLLLSKCGIVVMNHYRQQAVGNIMAMLWMGAKVYMNDQSTVYKYLSRIGIILFSISEHLKSSNKNALDLLGEEDVKHNRLILEEILGVDKLVYNIKTGISNFEI